MIERTTSLGTDLQSRLPDFPIRGITCKAGNKICRSLSKENHFPAMVCDICCTGPVFGDYDGYIDVWCEATIDGYICGHISHLDCDLRAYMAGKVRGSINLNAQYIMSILWFKDGFGSTCSEVYEFLLIYFL